MSQIVSSRWLPYLYEADFLLSQADHIHNLHGARAAVKVAVDFSHRSDPDLLQEYIEALLAKMRVAVETGVYPKRDSVTGKRLRAAVDALVIED